jgi:SAM-dependent methyltransferase
VSTCALAKQESTSNRISKSIDAGLMLLTDNYLERVEVSVDPKEHWERIYKTKSPAEVSWFQPEAALSLAMIRSVAPELNAEIIDVGGGASTLVDGLLREGYRRITVLDISAEALERSRARLGAAAEVVSWRAVDILDEVFPESAFDVWHDRAVFHFLTDPSARRRYVEHVARAVKPGGFVLVATFAEDGPTRCSGLDVVRYSDQSLHAEFGDSFTLLRSEREEHHTPAGATQRFVYCLCRR